MLVSVVGEFFVPRVRGVVSEFEKIENSPEVERWPEVGGDNGGNERWAALMFAASLSSLMRFLDLQVDCFTRIEQENRSGKK